MKSLRLILIVLTAGWLVACTKSSDACSETTDVKLGIAFMTRTYNISAKTYRDQAKAIDSLTVRGLDVDSILYKNNKKIASIKLPLHILQNSTAFEFQFNDIIDTITFYHLNNNQYFISLECGCVTAHELINITTTGHFSDSIITNFKDINNFETTHIQIFH